MSNAPSFNDCYGLLPVDIAAANVLLCSVPLPDTTRVWETGQAGGEVAWVTGTNYTKGWFVYLPETNMVYRDSAGGVSSIKPNVDKPRWSEVGPVNAWAWNDGRSFTKTVGISPMVISVQAGSVSRIAALGLEGVSEVQVDISSGGSQVFSQIYTVSDYRPGPAWWAWFFMRPSFGDQMLIDPLPPYPNGIVTITLRGTPGAKIGVGRLAIGNPLSLGSAEWGIEATPRDTGYSITDDWGETVDRPGVMVKDLSGTCVMPLEQANEAMRNFQKLMRRPGVLIGHRDSRFRFLMASGVLKSARMRPENPGYAKCTFEFEGRT